MAPNCFPCGPECNYNNLESQKGPPHATHAQIMPSCHVLNAWGHEWCA